MWVEFVVRVFLCILQFSTVHEKQHTTKFQFDQEYVPPHKLEALHITMRGVQGYAQIKTLKRKCFSTVSKFNTL